MDLGTGCGILGLLLLASGRAQRLTAVEIQPEMAALAQRNAEANGLAARMQVLCGDLRTLVLPRVEGVVFNPPYFAAHTGAASPNRSRDIARREQFGTLADFVAVAARHLQPQGWAAAIVRHERGAEIARLAAANGLSRLRQRLVLPRVGQAPRHVLTDMRAGTASIEVQAPLVVHVGEARAFGPEVSPWVEGQQS